MTETKKKQSLDESRTSLIKFDMAYGLAKQIVQAAKWILIMYFAADMARSLGGKLTLADVSLKAVLAHDNAASYVELMVVIVIIALIVAALGIAYGRWESRLRKDNVERLTQQIIDLQKMLDPKRTSSMLTKRGETSEKDKR